MSHFVKRYRTFPHFFLSYYNLYYKMTKRENKYEMERNETESSCIMLKGYFSQNPLVIILDTNQLSRATSTEMVCFLLSFSKSLLSFDIILWNGKKRQILKWKRTSCQREFAIIIWNGKKTQILWQKETNLTTDQFSTGIWYHIMKWQKMKTDQLSTGTSPEMAFGRDDQLLYKFSPYLLFLLSHKSSWIIINHHKSS